MGELEKAIEEITYECEKFPGRALRTIVEHREEAVPYLRGAVEKALREGKELEEEYQLHFYALYLLGEFEDRESFPRIMELVSLPGDTLELLIGDTITEGLKDILYHTYNGDIGLLKKAAVNEQANEFARTAVVDVMGQLYLDGSLEEEEWKAFIKQSVYDGKEYNYFYNGMASAICQCHFTDMLPEIRHMLDEELMDERVMGDYDSCVDEMFAYWDWKRNFCSPSINTVERLGGWAMFEDRSEAEDSGQKREAFEKLMQQAVNSSQRTAPVRKVGRNDPCPCGSGKKYKFCCLNKPKSPLDSIESPGEREKALERYPYTGPERLEGRVYLEDCFDSDSIETDKLLYLGLMHRPGFIWLRNREQEEKRSRAYLKLAYERFKEKIEKEGVRSFEEYDQRFSIHYFCREWMLELLRSLQEEGDMDRFQEVRAMYDRLA